MAFSALIWESGVVMVRGGGTLESVLDLSGVISGR